MPFKKTEMASNGVKFDIAVITSSWLVKSLLSATRNINIIAVKIMLISMLVPFTTNTENLATFAWPAPSSLLTRTLATAASPNINCMSQFK
ncbi:hypothetical protein EV2_025184 [Malus domestica]